MFSNWMEVLVVQYYWVLNGTELFTLKGQFYVMQISSQVFLKLH